MLEFWFDAISFTNYMCMLDKQGIPLKSLQIQLSQCRIVKYLLYVRKLRLKVKALALLECLNVYATSIKVLFTYSI